MGVTKCARSGCLYNTYDTLECTKREDGITPNESCDEYLETAYEITRPEQGKLNLFIINGQGESGKDTFVEMVQEQVEECYCFSSVDKIKEAMTLLGWNGIKDLKSRDMMCKLKQMYIDLNDGPYNYVCKTIKDIIYHVGNKPVSIFVMIREPEEIIKVKQTFNNCKTILVTSKEDKIFNVSADDNVFNYNYDIRIRNESSKEHLNNLAKMFAKLYC